MPKRPRESSLLGPLGGWELVRLARRGQAHRGRLLVLYFLLIGFVLTPILWFPHVDPVELFTGGGHTLSLAEAARFADRFALALLEAVLFAVAAMAPGYAASAIAEEKERQTLDLLLTTSLTDREIVLGKAAGRFGFVAAAAAAGLPVLAAVTLLGGADVRFLLAGCAVVGSTGVLATAIGVSAACAAPDLRGAIVSAYGWAVALIGMLNPFVALAWLEGAGDRPIMLLLGGVGFPLFQLLFAATFLTAAVRQLRTGETAPPVARVPVPAIAPQATPEPAARPEPVRDFFDPTLDWPARPPPRLPPVDEDSPLLWKERHVTGRRVGAGEGDTARLVRGLFGVLACLLFVFGGCGVASRLSTGRTDDAYGHLLMTGGTVAAGLFLIPAAVGLASAVARERHRKTLDALLALPIDRRVILRAKVRAVAERGWWWAPMGVAAIWTAFGVEGGWKIGLAAAAFLTTGVGLVFGLGMLLSVRLTSEVRAFRFLVPAVVLVVGGPVGVWNQTDWHDPAWSVAGLAAAAVAFALAGVVLWHRAARELTETAG